MAYAKIDLRNYDAEKRFRQQSFPLAGGDELFDKVIVLTIGIVFIYAHMNFNVI